MVGGHKVLDACAFVGQTRRGGTASVDTADRPQGSKREKLKEESAPFKLSSAASREFNFFPQQRFIHIYTSPNTDRKGWSKKNLGIAEVNYM